MTNSSDTRGDSSHSDVRRHFVPGTTSNVKVRLLGSADFYDELFRRLLKKETLVIDMSGDLPTSCVERRSHG
jgi:hypothetical protein